MKISDKQINKESVRRKALISYGRGPEGEEVMIDITESKRTNLKIIVAFIIIFPVIILLFSAIYGFESLDITSGTYFSKSKDLIFSSVLCGILLNWLIQAVVYIIVNPRS